MDFNTALEKMTLLERVDIKKLHFTFNKKVPTNSALWKWIEKQEHLTIEGFKITDSKIAIHVHSHPSDPTEGVVDFTDMFCSKFNATTGKGKK